MAFKSYHDSEVRRKASEERNYATNRQQHTCYNCIHCMRYNGNYYCSNEDNTRISKNSTCCSEFSASPYSSPLTRFDD